MSAVVLTGDVSKGEELAYQIEAGMVFVNDPQKSGSNYPSGGIKDSGYGRECGRWGLEEFSNIKAVSINK